MLESFTVDTFDEGDIFKVFYGEDQCVEITLMQKNLSKFRNPISKRAPFFLIFTSVKEIWIEAGCYKMEQKKVGNFNIAITPTMPLMNDDRFNYYEATFS